MVAAGIGITVLPRTAVPDARADGLLTYVAFDPPAPQRRVVLAWRKSFPRRAAIDAFRRAVLAVPLPEVSWLEAAQPTPH